MTGWSCMALGERPWLMVLCSTEWLYACMCVRVCYANMCVCVVTKRRAEKLSQAFNAFDGIRCNAIQVGSGPTDGHRSCVRLPTLAATFIPTPPVRRVRSTRFPL